MAAFYPLRKINSLAFSVTTASQLVLAANEHRKFCVFINDSNRDIYLKFGGAAALNQGIRISANGFSYEIDVTNLWVGEVYAIHGGAGTKNLLIEEYS
jgi:hypothetical protein